uniref:Uncharacterized protein n=1 Tax=Aegilops tauschii subsp. strangulata TaxID=200361 RepID=A0A453R054_AEGTS
MCQSEVPLLHLAELVLPLQRATFIRHYLITVPQNPSVEVTHVMVIRSSSSGSGSGGATLLLLL